MDKIDLKLLTVLEQDARQTLSQIAKNEGDITQALSYGQRALALSPGNKDLINYVDSLRNSSGENL